MSVHASTAAAKPATAAMHVSAAFPYSVSGCWMRLRELGRALFNRPAAGARPGDAGSFARLEPPSRSVPPPEMPPAPTAAPVPAFVESYRETLDAAWRSHDWGDVVFLVETLYRCWREDRQVFLCGNGGSAANAIHLANDFLYGIDKQTGRGLRVTALPANAAVLTCLANDISYPDIFAQQLAVLARPGDVLIALSGSGNSPNILNALTRARDLGVTTFAILGFTGGRALALADHAIHFPVHDMQVAEDLQMMVGHMVMQWLSRRNSL